MLHRFWLKVEKRPTTEPTNIRKTLNVRQRHISTFLNAINNKTLDPQQVVSFSAPRAPSWRDPLGHNRPLSALISKSKPTISRTRSSTLIPRGIHRDRKTRDKPITSPSQRNKLESSSDRKPVVKKRTHFASKVPRRKSG